MKWTSSWENKRQHHCCKTKPMELLKLLEAQAVHTLRTAQAQTERTKGLTPLEGRPSAAKKSHQRKYGTILRNSEQNSKCTAASRLLSLHRDPRSTPLAPDIQAESH